MLLTQLGAPRAKLTGQGISPSTRSPPIQTPLNAPFSISGGPHTQGLGCTRGAQHLPRQVLSSGDFCPNRVTIQQPPLILRHWTPVSPQVLQPLFLTRQTPCSALPKHHPFHTPWPLQLHMCQLQQLLGSVVFSPDTIAVLPTVISTVTTAPGTCLPATARPGWLDSPLGPSPAYKSLRNRLHQFPGLMAGAHGAWGTHTPRKILDQKEQMQRKNYTTGLHGT